MQQSHLGQWVWKERNKSWSEEDTVVETNITTKMRISIVLHSFTDNNHLNTALMIDTTSMVHKEEIDKASISKATKVMDHTNLLIW
jgi:hypothetical protein